MKQSIIIVLAVTFLVLVSCNNVTVPGLHPGSPESAGVSAGRLARIDTVLKEYIDSGWIAGAVGFISRNGKIIYHKAFGVSDIENNTPMRTDNIFRIASQTKAIVSVGMMMLYEEGKFLLDDPVSKYIPEFKNPAVLDKFSERDTSYTTLPARREITIRDLFTHTSGIDYAGIGSDVMRKIYTKGGIRGGFGGDEVTIGDDMVRLGKMPLVHHPGEKFTYGLNVDVIGYLIEILSGEKLDIWLDKEAFSSNCPISFKETVWFDVPVSFELPSHKPRIVLFTRIPLGGEDGIPIATSPLQSEVPDPPRNRADYTNTAFRKCRQIRMAADHNLCVFCKEPADSVHHVTYDRAGGNEVPADLRSLCRLCHDAITMLEYGFNLTSQRIDPEDDFWRQKILQKRNEIISFRSLTNRRRAFKEFW